MPQQQQPNNQLCTYATAKDLAERLRDIGIPVGTIYEIDTNGSKYDTTSELYINDGKQYQYVATIWGGPEQSLAMTDAMFKQRGYNMDTFTKLATTSNKLPAEAAIVALHGNYRAINANLSYQMQ